MLACIGCKVLRSFTTFHSIRIHICMYMSGHSPKLSGTICEITERMPGIDLGNAVVGKPFRPILLLGLVKHSSPILVEGVLKLVDISTPERSRPKEDNLALMISI